MRMRRRVGARPFVLVSLFVLSLPTAPWADEPDTDGHHRHEGGALDEIVVTISGHEKSRFDVIHGTNVLDGDDLRRQLEAGIGDTLSRQTGVSSTGFAPGASRPVIRGLGGPRVRVLQNGVGTVDASTTSEDHAVASEPLLAERIEVLRGAGTLRYGSSAVGGVVNVIDGRVPSRVPENGMEAVVEGGYGSAADERRAAGAANAAVPLGPGHLVIHGDGFIRRTHDLEVPGGRVENSAVESHGGSGGLSFVGDDGFLGVSFSRGETVYGVPLGEEEDEEGHHEEEEHGDEEHGHENVQIDGRQNRFDLASELRRDFGPFAAVAGRAVWADYQHTELEGGERGTVFENRGLEGRLELIQQPFGALDGVVGFQFLTRDFEAIGEEAFVPQTDTLQWGLFAVEELHLDPFTIEGGLRLERTEYDPSRGFGDASFTGVSASLGAAWEPTEEWILGASLSRTERAPSVEELFSDGPHLATGGFEIGDADLDEEVAWSLELTTRRRLGRLTGGLNLFYTRFEDFIFQQEAGGIEDGLPIRLYVQRDAMFHGAELDIAYELFETDAWTGILDLGADYVRGREHNGSDLPRIPPIRVRVGAEARSTWVDGRIEVLWVDDQSRVADGEAPTDDHTLLNASLSFRPMPEKRPDLSILLQGRNLTDEKARNHVSFLKDQLPLAGRDVRVSVRLAF